MSENTSGKVEITASDLSPEHALGYVTALHFVLEAMTSTARDSVCAAIAIIAMAKGTQRIQYDKDLLREIDEISDLVAAEYMQFLRERLGIDQGKDA